MNRQAEESLRRIYQPWNIGERMAWNMQTWNSDLPIFEQLIKRTRPTRIIDVGSWLGGSAIQMAKICRRMGLDTTIFCIDTWLGETDFMAEPEIDIPWRGGVCNAYRQFASNVMHENLQDMIVPYPQTSTLAAIWLKRQKVKAELIFIPAGHDSDSVLAACKSYFPLCSGTMFGDDFCRDAVARPVRAFAATDDLSVYDMMPHWVIHRPALPPRNPKKVVAVTGGQKTENFNFIISGTTLK